MRSGGDLQGATASAVGLLDPFVRADADRSLGSPAGENLQALDALDRAVEVLWLRNLAAHDAEAMSLREGFASTAAWVAHHGQRFASSVATQVRLARRLFNGDLIQTGAALSRGELSADAARAIHRGTLGMSAEHVAVLQEILLFSATVHPPETITVLARAAKDHLASESDLEQRLAAAHAAQGLTCSEVGDLAYLRGMLSPEVAAKWEAVIGALSKPRPGPAGERDDRTKAQRVHDALGEVLDAAGRVLAGEHTPTTSGVLANVVLRPADVDRITDRLHQPDGGLSPADEGLLRQTCDSDLTWTLIDHPTDTDDPGEGAFDTEAFVDEDQPEDGSDDVEPCCEHPHDGSGHRGPVLGTPDVLPGTRPEGCPLTQQRWDLLRKALTALAPALGGIGVDVLDQGRRKRNATPAQRRALALRDGGCVFPHCHAPPGWCHAHHLIHWLYDGPTDLWNMALLCGFHHHRVHEGGWTLTQTHPGRWQARPPAQAHAHAA